MPYITFTSRYHSYEQITIIWEALLCRDELASVYILYSRGMHCRRGVATLCMKLIAFYEEEYLQTINSLWTGFFAVDWSAGTNILYRHRRSPSVSSTPLEWVFSTSPFIWNYDIYPIKWVYPIGSVRPYYSSMHLHELTNTSLMTYPSFMTTNDLHYVFGEHVI